MEKQNEVEVQRSIAKLIEIVAELRSPDRGCPWDLAQTHQSLIPYLLEEAYEVTDAIREGSDTDLIEELGDLFLQIILHCQIGLERGEFSIKEVSRGICTKLIRRHPHVFSNHQIKGIEEAKEIWKKTKQNEIRRKGLERKLTEKIKLKIRSKPALDGSIYISKKASELGFEWNNIEEIWVKLNEEIEELKEAISNKDMITAEEELGDVIFTLINIARWSKLKPEEGLNMTNKKIINRLEFIEKSIECDLSEISPFRFEKLWEEAKAYLKKK